MTFLYLGLTLTIWGWVGLLAGYTYALWEEVRDRKAETEEVNL